MAMLFIFILILVGVSWESPSVSELGCPSEYVINSDDLIIIRGVTVNCKDNMTMEWTKDSINCVEGVE